MDRRGFLGGCACCGLMAWAPHASAESLWHMPDRFQRPGEGSDEGGLWALLDREETKLKRSKFLIRDQALNAYVSDIVCKLAGQHCPDIRTYVVRTPYFNANMAPNGMMQVWTGLLLRMANEAQLAAVLGHEIGHYLARHSLDRLRDAKSRSAFGQFLGIALGAAGAGGVNAIAQLALTAGMFAFTRDHEREADRIGLKLMADAGYEPMEASRVWEQLMAELKSEGDWTGEPASRSVLFASHPREAERRDELAAQAAALGSGQWQKGEEAWSTIVGPYRWSLFEDELRRRRSGETLALLDRLLAQEPHSASLFYFRGEAYRMRATAGDRELALGAYEAAEKADAPPPELYRSRGMLLKAAGDDAGAKDAFRRYLELKPAAQDAELVASYLI